MWVVAFIVGEIFGVFAIALLRANDCEECALRAYRDEEDENK